jgi:MFS transporter, FHS family, glucose/mannose:H+ symporter
MPLPEKQPNLNSVDPNSARGLTYAAYAAFVPIGIVTVLLGPLLPTLSTRWSLDYLQAGALFPMQYWASTVAVGLSGTLVSRFGFRFAMKAGLVLMGACVALLLSGSRLQGMIWIAGYGAGLGLAIPAANLLVAKVNPERRSSALNTLNFCWGIGAVACPFLVAAAAKNHRVSLFLVLTAALSLLVTIGIAAMPSSIVEPDMKSDATRKTKTVIDWKRPIFFILAAMFFVYVGVENGFGGWVASYAKSLGSLTTAMAAMTPSFFYASLTLGRWVAPLLLRRIHDVKLAQAGVLAACGGMAGLLLSHSLVAVALSALLAGLGLSSVYPITISLLSREYGDAASRVGSVMFTMANLGGGCLPWLVGALSTRVGALKAGLAVPLVGGLALYLLFLRNWKEAAP